MIFNTPLQLLNAYKNGFIGSVCDKEGQERLLAESKHPYFGAAAQSIADSGKGQMALLFKNLLKFDQRAFSERQTTGDCLIGTDKVRMADGSQKMIKDIEAGEYVISAYGNKRKVTSIFKKPYSKAMLKISVAGYQSSITATPDHRFIIDPITMDYKAIGELEVGNKIYLPPINHEEKNITFDMINYFNGECITENTDFKSLRLEPVSNGKIRAKGGRATINRFIKLDEKLSWLIGLYAAEGGIDGSDGKLERITYNLGSHEAIMAEQVKQYIKDIFDIDAYIYQIPSKPSVVYVRINSVFVANLFKELCSGNTYTKSINKKFFITTKSNKLALLKGWFDGDGHKSHKWSTAVSVSRQLVLDFADIANSINLSISTGYRKAYAHSKEAYTLNIKAEHSDEFNTTKGHYVSKISNSKSDIDGRMVQIKKIEPAQSDDGFVYCIEVENDHNFICNGFGVSNCVSHATRNGVDITRSTEIINGDKESFIVRSATEGIYGVRGHGGQGMTCERAVRFVTTDGGILLRKKYGSHDLSVYNGRMAASWGRSGTPRVLIEEAKKNQVKTASNIRSVAEARDALFNGYGVFFCSNLGFSSNRDKNGISQRSGRWMHAMSFGAMDDTRDIFNETLFLILNSWGAWNGGPKRLQQPDGSFWVRQSVVEDIIAQGSMWALSNVDGFPAQKIRWSLNEVL